MAGSKVNNYAIGDSDIEAVMLTTDQIYKGQCQVTLTEMSTTTVPKIAAGSWIENNGTLFKFDADETLSGSPSDGIVYIRIVPSTTTCTAEMTNTAPTWSDSKQGWYGTSTYANYRYVGYMIKASSGYTCKRILSSNPSASTSELFDLPYIGAFTGGTTYTGTTLAYPSLSAVSTSYIPGSGIKNTINVSSGDILSPVDGLYAITWSTFGTGILTGNTNTSIRINGTVYVSYHNIPHSASNGGTPSLHTIYLYLFENDLIDFGAASFESGESGSITINSYITLIKMI